MVLNQQSSPVPVGNDFFEFEVNSASVRLSFSFNPPTEPFEFKSHMSSSSFHLQEIIPTPADELFCNGKILPFHHKKEHKTSSFSNDRYKYLQPPTSSTTPSQSCHVMRLRSCRRSSDSKFDDYFVDFEISNLDVVDDRPESCSKSMKLRLSGQKLKPLKEYLISLFRKKPRFTLLTSVCHAKLINVRKSKGTSNTKKSCNAVNSPFRLSKKEKSCKRGKEKGKEICRDSLSERWIRSLSGSINWLSKTKNPSVTPIYSSASLPSSSLPAYYAYKVHSDDANCVANRNHFIQEPEKSIVEAILYCKQSQMLESL